MDKNDKETGKRLTHGSLFSGIGGFDLGARLAGIDTLWCCEIESFPSAVLRARFPESRLYGDIREIAWLPRVDIVSGGFPCQDISLAGKGMGIGGSRSGLWSEMFRVVREVGPRYVVVENSPALAFRGLERVLCDLYEIGYDAEWQCIPNLAFGFPHRRERLYLIAYPHTFRLQAPDGEHGEPASVFKPWTSEEPAGRALAQGVLSLGDCEHYRGGHGVPGWTHRIAALGNAVNPCVARYLFECIRHFDDGLTKHQETDT